MARKYRTWTREDEVRLESLVRAVEERLEQGAGEEAARQALPAWAGCDTITELAEHVGAERSSLSVCLAASSRSPHWKIRGQLERGLRLPPGGITRVLSMIEAERERAA